MDRTDAGKVRMRSDVSIDRGGSLHMADVMRDEWISYFLFIKKNLKHLDFLSILLSRGG